MAKFERQYKGKDQVKERVTEEYVLEMLDGPYVDPALAMEYLKANGIIQTPFAWYSYTEEGVQT